MGTTVRVASILEDGHVFQEKRTPGFNRKIQLVEIVVIRPPHRLSMFLWTRPRLRFKTLTIAFLYVVKVGVHSVSGSRTTGEGESTNVRETR